MKGFLKFGRISVKQLCSLLFWIGSVGILTASSMGGYHIYLTNTYQKVIRQGNWYTGVEANNLPLGLFCGILYFVIGVLTWRLICEIIYIILQYFQNNTKEDREEERMAERSE